MNLNYIVRYHDARSGNYVPIMTGTSEDNTQQYVMLLGSKKVPIYFLTSLVELSKKLGNHSWRVGLDQWNYKIDKFRTESMSYSQSITANSDIIEGTERYGKMNIIAEQKTKRLYSLPMLGIYLKNSDWIWVLDLNTKT